MPNFDTLEEARAEIIRLQQELNERTNERDQLSQNNETLTADVERLRTINQNYFNQLRAQTPTGEQNDDDEEEVPTCEEYALTLKI